MAFTPILFVFLLPTDEAESIEAKERSINGDTVDGETIVNEIKTIGEETANELVSVKRPAESPPTHDVDIKRRRLDFATKGHKTENELDILQALQGNTSSPSPTPSPDIGMASFRFPEKPASEIDAGPVDSIQPVTKERKKALPKAQLKSPPIKGKQQHEKGSNSDSPSKVKSPLKKPASTKSPKSKKKTKTSTASKSSDVESKLKSPGKTSRNSTTNSPIKSPEKSLQVQQPIKSPPVASIPVKSPPITSIPVKSLPVKSPPISSPILSIKSPPFLSPSKSSTVPSTPNKAAAKPCTPSPPSLKSRAKEKQKPKLAKDINVSSQNKKTAKKVKKGSQKLKKSEQDSASNTLNLVSESSSEQSDGSLLSPFVLPKLKIKPILEKDKMTSYSVSELVHEGKSQPVALIGKDQKKKTKKPKLTSSDESTTSTEKLQKKIKIKKIKADLSSEADVKSPPNKPVIKPITITMPTTPESMLSVESPGGSELLNATQQGETSDLLAHVFKKKKKKHKEKEKDKDKTKKKDKSKEKMHGHSKVCSLNAVGKHI